MLLTLGTIVPWLPNLVLSSVMDVDERVLAKWLGVPLLYDILDSTNYMYYLVPCIFPVLAVVSDPVLRQATNKSAVSTVLSISNHVTAF